MKRSLLNVVSVCAFAIALSAGGTAMADSVDYGSLQDLFGEPVTTSATGTPQRASEIAANMTIITADEIRQSGSRSIPQILARVPGLNVLQEGANGFDVGVRGYQQGYQPRLLVLLDGRQVFMDDYSRTIWENIPVNIDDIRQIEVVKGASSALFGSNAAGGVINIVTFSPKYDNSNVASLSMGTQNTLRGDATTTLKYNDKAYAKFSFGGMNMDQIEGFKSFENSVRVNPESRYITGTAVVDVLPNLSVNFSSAFSDTKLNQANFAAAMVAEHPSTYSVQLGADWQTPYGLIRSNNYLNHSYNAYDSQVTGTVHLGTTLFVASLEDQFKVGADHTFRTGVEFRHKEFKNRTDNDVNQPNLNRPESNVYSVNGTWLWNINKDLSWTNAARFDFVSGYQDGLLGPNAYFSNDDYDREDNVFTVNSGIAYKLTEDDTIRVGYGRGSQLPSMVQVGYNSSTPIMAGVALELTGNPNLKPTIVTNYELGYDRKISQINSVAKASLFYEKNQDVVSFLYSGVRVVAPLAWASYIATNVGDSYAYGGEIELKGSNKGFRWDASYSFSRVTDEETVKSENAFQGSMPQHSLRLDVGYSTGAWEIDANGQYKSDIKMMRSENGIAQSPLGTEGYVTFGGRIGYKLTENATLALSGANLNRQKTTASPFPAVERQALLTLTSKF